MNVLAFDIGGTAIKVGLVSPEGNILKSEELDSEAKKGGDIIVQKLLAAGGNYEGFDRIGISTAGLVDVENGAIIYASDALPGYTGTQLRARLEERFHVPVMVENDVNAAALGEAAYGAAQGVSDFLMLTYGTSVGGAIVTDGKVYGGKNGLAGEMGHTITHAGGKLCACGFRGCYCQYAATTALVESAMALNPEWKNGRIIFQELERGNKPLADVLDSWTDEIVLGLANFVHIFNPPLILLGGGIMNESVILDAIQKKLVENIMPGYREVVVKQAKLGNKAGLLGAAYCALQYQK